ncbi:hypothetical protein J5N97_016586 [Dioscorea zingiberensis]|uniref:Pentatricopeptide repeat-containing protein n=1 Tax=Dioscorea zingiberensis TaxID=325984 RepID=A0A9D5CJU0_9LILI|nr:hypothetical protein J5N97_016586 [Dioscorea zingiberensis]
MEFKLLTSNKLLPRARCLSLLGLSSNKKQAMQIHAQMITNSLFHGTEAVVELMESYFSVQEGEEYARLVFWNSDEAVKNASAWSFFIQRCHLFESLPLYALQIRLGVMPDKVSSICVLRACARSLALREGVQIHAQVFKAGLASDMAVQTTGIHFYGSCRDIESACQMFDEMRERSCVTWNTMMSAYCASERPREALELFNRMRREGVKPTERTVLPLMSACAQLGELDKGTAVHAFICKAIVDYHQDLFIGTELVDMYSKCGSLSNASKVFEGMAQRNVLAWTAMTAGLAMHGKGQEALRMLESMQEHGIIPNVVTFTCLLAACCHAGLVQEGLHLFELMPIKFGLKPQVQHYSCIVDLLGRTGMIEEAYNVIRNMPIEPDAVVWRALLSACKMHDHVDLAAEAAGKLLQIEQTSPALDSSQDFIALSNVYASAERWDDVLMVRKAMMNLSIQNKPGFSSVNVHKLD